MLILLGARCQDRESRAAVGALGGAEILLGADAAWSAGVEAGYWFTVKRDAASRDLDHLTFSAMLRWRP